MEKETILSELKKRLGTTSLSERTVSEYVGNIFPSITDDAQVNDTFYQLHIGILKSVEGQLNKDVADRVKVAQAEWEKQHGKPVDKPVDKPADKPVEPQPNEDMAKMMAMIEAMQKKLDDQDKEKQLQSKIDAVKSAMKMKGATDEAVLMFTFKGESVDAEKSVDELTEGYLKAYDANYKTLRGDGAVPRNGGGSGSSDDKFLDDYFAQKAREGKFPEQK